MKNLTFLIFMLLGCNLAFCHDSEADHPTYYTFKEQIRGMCAGHHHLDYMELKKICNHFPDHYTEILELQADPPKSQPEKFILSLTNLVIFSDTLTKDQKHEFCRQSYNLALEARKKGDEWKWLLGILVEQTDTLTLAELQDLLRTTTHNPMKPLIQKAIERHDGNTSIKDRPAQQESKLQSDKLNLAIENNHSEHNVVRGLLWLLGGVLILVLVWLSLAILKKKI